MKNCLIIYFSQSGQTFDIARAVTEPLKECFHLHFEELKPTTPFPFPWKGMSFFQAFPESVMEIPCPLQPFTFDTTIKFDLVILAYPVWYLSPPIPMSAFLQSEQANAILKDTPVITIMGVRNMWVMALQSVRARIKKAGGRLVGNIVLEDPSPNLVSVITIVRWMMTADKHGRGIYARLFPPAGVPDSVVTRSSRFGEIILKFFRDNEQISLQEELVRHGAVIIHPVLVNIEKRAKVMFGILARWILKKGGYNDPGRLGRLQVFKYYLFTVIYLVSPIASTIFWIASKLRPGSAKKTIQKYSSVD